MAKKLNPIEVIQKWMDTMAGQTFMNYAYSWGAAIVILGTLFKLTHIPGANLMLFIGMGTEVFVFIIAGFERVTEKVPEISGGGAALSSETVEELAAVASAAAQNGGGGATVIGGGGIVGGGVVGGGGTVVIGGGGMPSGGGTVVIGGGGIPATGGSEQSEGGEEHPVVIGGGAVGGSGVVGGGQPVVLGGGVVGGPAFVGGGVSGGVTEAAQIQATDPAAVEEAVKNYAEQLTELTEVLGRVKVQAERMSTDSEEMENLNRTLTGIATVYELQLRNISKQVSTIEQIDEQTRRMAQQIEELNNVYARMIKALTVNVVGPITPQADEK
ncbi:MAG: gliding motility protein GldL [Bacteroidaceae bacterium]|nr:gliding motility protein GldL [Bacteroidaceae bacterium]